MMAAAITLCFPLLLSRQVNGDGGPSDAAAGASNAKQSFAGSSVPLGEKEAGQIAASGSPPVPGPLQSEDKHVEPDHAAVPGQQDGQPVVEQEEHPAASAVGANSALEPTESAAFSSPRPAQPSDQVNSGPASHASGVSVSERSNSDALSAVSSEADPASPHEARWRGSQLASVKGYKRVAAAPDGINGGLPFVEQMADGDSKALPTTSAASTPSSAASDPAAGADPFESKGTATRPSARTPSCRACSSSSS